MTDYIISEEQLQKIIDVINEYDFGIRCEYGDPTDITPLYNLETFCQEFEIK